MAVRRRKRRPHWLTPKITPCPYVHREVALPAPNRQGALFYDVFESEPLAVSFPDEFVRERDEMERERNREAMKLVKEAGFIPLPTFFTRPDGERVEVATWVHPDFVPSCSEGFLERNGIAYNVYIPSFGRPDAPTVKRLISKFDLDCWYLFIDPESFAEYGQHYPLRHLIVRNPIFRSEEFTQLYSPVSSPNGWHGTSGIYNSILAFSQSLGEKRYWTMDDDLLTMAMKAHKGSEKLEPGTPYNKFDFYRCSRLNTEFGFSLNEFLRQMEEISEKVINSGFITIEKFGVYFDRPFSFTAGTRAYTFYLTDNNKQTTHFPQHNNDVATSIEMDKMGYYTVLFNGIAYHSMPTQAGGGLTELYRAFGTLDKGKALVRAQPLVSKIVYKFSRIHHIVNYAEFIPRARLLMAD